MVPWPLRRLGYRPWSVRQTTRIFAIGTHYGQAYVIETKTPTLSEREIQILDGLVKGYANKVIGRRCNISEATVKVHMKSILRKIRVDNRTQAAIWALEHSYCGEEPNTAALKANGAQNRHTSPRRRRRPLGSCRGWR